MIQLPRWGWPVCTLTAVTVEALSHLVCGSCCALARSAAHGEGLRFKGRGGEALMMGIGPFVCSSL
jgi:hypothetical protein